MNKLKLTVIICSLLFHTVSHASEVTRSRIIMGTLVQIKVVNEDMSEEETNKAIDNAFGAVEEIDRLMSNYKEDSEVSRINHLGQNEKMNISPQTFDVIKKSMEFGRLTGGAFDITVEPLLRLWGVYSGGGSQIPALAGIKTSLELVGYDNILLDNEGKTIGFSKAGTRIDLGGIAKGYAVDKAIEALKNYNVRSALVEAGGDIFAMGKGISPGGWQIGVQHPRIEDGLLTTLELEDKAVATSGDYERYFFIENKRYSHIIDPETGWPKSDVPASVTIIARDATTADALATAVFVMGPEKGLKLIESLKGVEGMLVSEEGGKMVVNKSEGFDKYASTR